MSEQVTLEAEFLRRALEREDNAERVAVTPGTLPPDLPVTLPDLPGMRVLGGVRSVLPGWTFASPGSARAAAAGPVRLQWRAFLDIPAPQPQVMDALLGRFTEQGWQESQVFQQVFVEAARSEWAATALEPARTLGVQSRQQGGVTQVELTVADTDPGQVEHLRGRWSHPHFADQFEPPLPTLILPDGWKGQMQTGQGGPIRSQLSALRPPPGPAPDPAALLAHFLPQLERQGWRLLHREDGPESLSVHRTPLGVGTLSLRVKDGGLSALIVHVTAEEGRGSSRVTVPVS
ncbi:hypothetical protein QOL99_13310 [Deinococcus sp. MIMF12]|uniref:Uncharacterized protein n=1 Tax=Deinococcus rhizophilus TaxID=3049544 RepID=A0ABT7JKX8_9DEIO|nr:hypothetical protein [Deinococcus rhizophilus]MDL2345123.1 hypothetical protein [Deinococcus rhizophilus]